MEEENKFVNKKSNIKWFSELSINSKNIAGEKASYLSEANNKRNFSKNVEIPTGFVLTKNAIGEFFLKGNIKNAISNVFSETNKDNLEELKSASNKIKNLIMKTKFPEEIEEEISEAYETLSDNDLEMGEGVAYNILSNSIEPEFVAVRSSYRNELGDSYFNIKGKANIIYSIKRIVASLFNPETILEEINLGIKPEEVYPAIIIQKMVQSDKSGIVYSGDTITTNSIWGMGGGLKLDEIGKDEFISERSLRIIKKEINPKKYAITRESSGALKLVGLKEGYSFMQSLEEYEVQELCNIMLRLDDIFSERMQFEFAIVDSEISIIKINKVENKKVITPKVEAEEKELLEKKLGEDVQSLEVKSENQKEIATQTKIDVIIKNNKDKEISNSLNVRSGFLTLEDIIKSRGLHPSEYIENFNTKGYGEIIFNGLLEKSANLNEIWVRLSDFTNEEFKDLKGAREKSEINPIMGLNGIRYLLTNPELLKRELKAISKLSNEKNTVGVVIPKISSVYELKKVKEIIESLDVKMKIGIVLETPASIQLIKDFIDDGIDAVVFNGDTLTEYLLAIDSKNLETYKFYDDTNPALMYQLEYVIRVCNRNNIKTSFLGSATNKKEMIDYLVRKNINTIIVPVEKFNIVSNLVYSAEKEFIHGTDKEIRQYERTKEKDRQKKELEEFEAAKDEETNNKIIEDEKLNEEENIKEVKDDKSDSILSAEENSKDIQLIEKEKKEFLSEKGEGVENEIPKSESLVIHPDNLKVESPESVEVAMKMIDEHNNNPAPLNDVEIAMKEIENHNKKDSIELKKVDNKKVENIDESIKCDEDKNLNTDLVDSNEELESIPEDLEEIDKNLKEEKINSDIELIESEKKEYIENNKDENVSYSENSENNEDGKEGVSRGEKDVLGIF